MEIVLRAVTLADSAELAAALVRNRAYLAPFEPERPDAFFTAAGQREAIRASPPNRHPFAIVAEGRIVGCVTLSNVVAGSLQSCTVGYWVAEDARGQGVATYAVGLAVAHAFGPLGLHRVEAATLVANTPSQRVLEKCGFTRIGIAPRLVQIEGRWQDHVVFQRLVDDPPPAAARAATS